MTINFKFHSHIKKDGTQSLLIRIRDGKKDNYISLKGLSIYKKFWDKKNQMLSSKHPNAEMLNVTIKKYHDRIKKVKPLHELGHITFNECSSMLEGTGEIDSIKEFILMMTKQKTEQWRKNSLTAVNGFSRYANIENPIFNDINYNSLENMCVNMRKKEMQPETINNYLSHLRAVFNYAKRKKIIFSDYTFPSELYEKTRRHDKKIKTHLPKDIAEAINNIKLDNNHKRSVLKTIRDFEAIGFWLLMFSMRGLYGKDISSLTAKNYNYDFKFKIDQEINGGNIQRSLKGNSNFLDHRRHKTKNKMRIMITLPPIGGLIYILRRLVAQTHPKLSYLSFEDLKKPYEEFIKKKNYDDLKIFNHNPSEQIEIDDAIWNNINKHLKKMGLYSVQSARKTFATTCSSIGIDSSIERNLLGQSDPTILRHYDNFEDKRLVYKIQESHIKVLNAFRTIELFDMWVNKINQVFETNFDFHIGESSSVVYSNFYKKLTKIINVEKTLISNSNSWEEKYKLEN